MNKKVMFSLILFVGVFFAFKIKVEAVSCTYYEYKNLDLSNIDITKKVKITNYGDASSSVVTIITPDKEFNFLNSVSRAYPSELRFFDSNDVAINKGACPKFIKLSVHTQGFDYDFLDLYIVNVSGINNFINPPFNKYGKSIEEMGTYVISEEAEKHFNATEGIKCKYKNRSSDEYVYLKETNNGYGLYKGLASLTNFTKQNEPSNFSDYASNCPSYLLEASPTSKIREYQFSPKLKDLDTAMQSYNDNGYTYTVYDLAFGDTKYEQETTDPVDKYLGIGGDPVTNTCEGILGQDFIDWMDKYIFTPLRIIAPILLLIFTTLDFAKAVFADDKDALKKAQSNFVKRTIAVVLLFLLTYILDLIFTIITNGAISVCF